MHLKNKKILVTGALGFIGRTLLETLIEQNCEAELYGIDIKPFPSNANALKQNIHYEQLDIRNKELVQTYVQKHKFDGIIHLAAVSRVEDAENDKKNCIDTNYNGTRYIATAASENKNTWFIFGSSREVYGEQRVFPVSENADLLPLNIYGFYKLEGERIVKALFEKYCVLRFSNVYGNTYDIPKRVIPKFVQTALQGGELTLEGGAQIIDFTFIDDTVMSIIRCMEFLEAGRIKKETIHILPGRKNKITDIIDVLQKKQMRFSVSKKNARNYDVQQFVGNPYHMRDVLRINPNDFITLEEGIGLYISRIRRSSLTYHNS